MFSLLKNSWFIGISTGIISGILIYPITNWIMKKKGKEEYFKKVADANLYVIVALKPYISEKGLPDVDIFEAIISSTARAYSVEKRDMFSISIFCEELIREIISDVYVSSDKKKEYTDKLIAYKNEIINNIKNNDISEDRMDNYERTVMRRRMTAYMSLLTTALATCFSVIMLMSEGSFWDPFDNQPILWIPITTVLLTVFATFMVIMLDRLSRINSKKSLKLKFKGEIHSDNNIINSSNNLEMGDDVKKYGKEAIK